MVRCANSRAAVAESWAHSEEINVWLVDSYDIARALKSILSVNEIERADRLRLPTSRDRFVATRGALRLILSYFLDLAPSAIEFSYGHCGKPFVDEPLNHLGLQFNVSHTDNCSAIAVCKRHAIGIDLEEQQAADRHHAVFDRMCSPAEREGFACIPPSLRAASILHWWASKEAYLKGLGTGLSMALQEFDVSVDPTRPPKLLKPCPGCRQLRWSLYGWNVVTGSSCLGVVAADFEPSRIVQRRFVLRRHASLDHSVAIDTRQLHSMG